MTKDSLDTDETETETDRDRGILTDVDRTFLLLTEEERQEEYTRQGRSYRMRTIATRLQDSVLDFPLIVDRIDTEVFDSTFGADDAHGVSRTQRVMPSGFQFLIQAVLANEPDRPAERGTDVVAALNPVLDQFERAVQAWLNAEHQKTANIDVTVDVEGVRDVDDYVDDLKSRRVIGRERLKAAAKLTRAGYSDDEIIEIIGDGE